MARRVVITAMGLHTSLGNDPKTVLANLRSGRTAFERAAVDPDVVVCPAEEMDLKPLTGPCKNRRYLNRGAAFCVGAALSALKSSGLDRQGLSETGLFVGAGPNLDMDGELPRDPDGTIAWRRVQALWLLKFIANTPAALISQLAGIHGESLSIQTACTAGLSAIGEAFRKIRHGYLETALAGAGDSRLSPGGIMAYKKAQALFCGPGPADQACRPFDAGRAGFVSGEGGAFFMLESLEHARKRKAAILAEIIGFGAGMDGHGMTAPEPDGIQAERAVRKALADARLNPEQIRIISAHGTGTHANDTVEAEMIRRIFGPRRGSNAPWVMALKSWIGHLSAACGAAELALTLICLANDYWPRIRNLNTPCTEEISFLRQDLHRPVQYVLLQNFGFGGQNCALVIQKKAHVDAIG